MDWTGIETLIRDAERGTGTVGVTLTTADGHRFSHRGDRRFRAASTVKVPIMVELYRQVDRGDRSLGDRIPLREEDRAPGSGVLLHLHAGIELTLSDLIYLMISISDNTATNLLIDLAGIENVNRTMGELGMVGSTLGRKMKGRPAQGDELENWATPDDYATVVAAILNQTAASPGACTQMEAMIEKQQNSNRIARYLPDDEGLRWGSKTGQITGTTNDAGFIVTDRGSLIVSVFCEDLPDKHVGEQFIGDVTRAALKATGIATPLETS